MVRLEEATEKDLPLMMAWRSNPLVYQGFFQQNAPLDWDEHVKWFRSRNQDWRTFIAWLRIEPFPPFSNCEDYDRPIGVVTIGQLDHWSPEIGYYIGEVSLWGHGFGKMVVKEGIKWLQGYIKQHPHIEAVHTTVLKNNKRSVSLLKGLGFERMAEARKDEIWMSRGINALSQE